MFEKCILTRFLHVCWKSSASVKRNKKYIVIKFKPGIAYKGKKERTLWSDDQHYAEAWELALRQALTQYIQSISDQLAIPTAEPIIPTAEPIITARAVTRNQTQPGQLHLRPV